MPNPAWSPPKAGPKPPPSAPWTWRTRLQDAGISAIIYTDIARDGMKTGLNLEETSALANAVSRARSSPPAASAAWPTFSPSKPPPPRAPNLHGAIVGRALYDGSLDPQEALRAC